MVILLFLKIDKTVLQRTMYLPFLNRLKILFAKMDQKCKEAANFYGFNCTGCKDNCCLTRFYHHTLLEYIYIAEGCKTLSPEQQIQIQSRAKEVCRQTASAQGNQGEMISIKQMCPLNLNGLCILYDYRPMICRLHGIPHELQKSGQGTNYGAGCDTFTKQCKDKGYFKFDRTPFYYEMAELEKQLKQAACFTQKIKMTVAQIIVQYSL